MYYRYIYVSNVSIYSTSQNVHFNPANFAVAFERDS